MLEYQGEVKAASALKDAATAGGAPEDWNAIICACLFMNFFCEALGQSQDDEGGRAFPKSKRGPRASRLGFVEKGLVERKISCGLVERVVEQAHGILNRLGCHCRRGSGFVVGAIQFFGSLDFV